MINKSNKNTRAWISSRTLIAAAVAGLTVSATVAATGWSQSSAGWNTLDTLSGQEIYTRSAPDAEAAFIVPVGRSVNAAILDEEVQAVVELEVDSSARTREQLQIWGPWLSSTGVSDNARQLVRFLETSARHGLSPKAYGLDMLKEDIAAREKAATIATFETAAQRAMRLAAEPTTNDGPVVVMDNQQSIADADAEGERLERLLNSTFNRVAKHLGQGMVDPRKTQYRMYRDAPTVDTYALNAELEEGVLDVNSALRSVTPSNADYRRMVSLMDTLLAERARGQERTHVPETGALRVGHHHSDVMYIKRRMVETGELDPDTILTPMFDAPLKLAVAAFQERNGIPGSGIVDARTREAMNTSVDEAITEIALSQERWRWMPRELGDRHFFMNLPNYRLSMIDNGEQIVDMVVVVGAVEHSTPTFSREMTYIELNPTWSVPQSIAHRELLPKEIATPGYLAQRNFDFLAYRDDKYTKVDYNSVTPAQLRKRPFPYLIRQRAGSNNALGTVKFMMPNQYAIYFHDTQAKSLFALPDRAYSHGCIRLSDPKGLFRTVMEADGMSARQIARAQARTKTTRLILKTPIPTHLAYFTSWVDNNGVLQTRNDIYSHDEKLEDALRAAGTLLTELDSSRITASAHRHANPLLDDAEQG